MIANCQRLREAQRVQNECWIAGPFCRVDKGGSVKWEGYWVILGRFGVGKSGKGIRECGVVSHELPSRNEMGAESSPDRAFDISERLSTRDNAEFVSPISVLSRYSDW